MDSSMGADQTHRQRILRRRTGSAGVRRESRSALTRVVATCVVVVSVIGLAAADNVVQRVREWRTEHEKEILLELFDFLSIPNVASNKGDIRRNAD